MRTLKAKSESYIAVVHLISVWVIGFIIGLVLLPITFATLLLKSPQDSEATYAISVLINTGSLWLAIWLSVRFFIKPYYIITNAQKIVQLFFTYILVLTVIGVGIGLIAAQAAHRPVTDIFSIKYLVGNGIALATYYYASFLYIKNTPADSQSPMTPPQTPPSQPASTPQ